MAPPGLSPRARRLLPVFLLVLVALSIHRLWFAEAPAVPIELRGETMGTTWSVKVVSKDRSLASRDELHQKIELELARVNGLMSTWDPDSELSRFNGHRSAAPFPVAQETLAVVRAAAQVSERTGGAFDVTVGPLVEAWGFGATERAPAPPGELAIARIRERVGWERVGIDAAAGTLTKAHPELVCDLSALAKGFAVDRVANALIEAGEGDFLVEVGGELAARGAPAPGRSWRVGIEAPDPEKRRVFAVVALEDRAMATSGDYRNYYEADGVWLSHLIDPRTARPIMHELASVTVLHEQALLADALATGLMVLGPDSGFSLAEREGWAALFLTREGDGGARVRATAAFRSMQPAFVSEAAAP